MADLKEFLSSLAGDPRRLGEFLVDPEKAMTAAELSDEDRMALISGMPGMIAARLAGVSIEEAFILRPQFVAPQFVAPQFVAPQFVAPQFVAPQFVAPQYVVPPQFVAPQFVAPQFVVPPQFVAPQFVPPQFVVPPPQFVPPQFVAPQFVAPQLAEAPQTRVARTTTKRRKRT